MEGDSPVYTFFLLNNENKRLIFKESSCLGLQL